MYLPKWINTFSQLIISPELIIFGNIKQIPLSRFFRSPDTFRYPMSPFACKQCLVRLINVECGLNRRG